MFLLLWFCFNLFIVLLAGPLDIAKTKETCADLQVDGGRSTDVVLEALENSYINKSFMLTTHRCEYYPEYIRVKLSVAGKNEKEFGVPLCTVVFGKESCNVTELSFVCRCSDNDKQTFWIYIKVSRSQRMYVLEWTDSPKNPVTKKKNIIVLLSEDESQSQGTLQTTAAAAAAGLFVLIFAVIAGVCIVRRRTDTGSRQDSGQRADNEVPSPVQEEGFYHSLMRRQGQNLTSTVQISSFNPRNAADVNEPGRSTLARGHDPGRCQGQEEHDVYLEPLTPMAILLRSLKTKFANQS